MARTLQQLTIFVSGPSTVEAEKAALRVVVDEINRRSEKTHAVTLRVVGWPDDIRPGVNTDPQSEIGHQIGSDFDIYVGILGSRFGTPTVRGGSGTEQEFEEAISRFRKDPSAVRLLFYFKRDAEDPFSVDLSQLQKVRDFRQSLGSRGGCIVMFGIRLSSRNLFENISMACSSMNGVTTSGLRPWLLLRRWNRTLRHRQSHWLRGSQCEIPTLRNMRMMNLASLITWRRSMTPPTHWSR